MPKWKNLDTFVPKDSPLLVLFTKFQKKIIDEISKRTKLSRADIVRRLSDLLIDSKNINIISFSKENIRIIEGNIRDTMFDAKKENIEFVSINIVYDINEKEILKKEIAFKYRDTKV